MAHEVRYLPLAELVPADRNPKAHNIPALVASLGEFGVVDAIGIIDGRTGKLVGGHGRVEALLVMQGTGMEAPAGVAVEAGEWQVPVLVGWASHSDDEAKAAVIALNQHTMGSGWDVSELASLLDELNKVEWPLATIGFTPEDLEAFDRLLAPPGASIGEMIGNALGGEPLTAQQWAFVLTDEEMPRVKRAIAEARARMPEPERRPGAVLAYLCDEYLESIE